MKEKTDNELLVLIVSGDTAAFAVLHDRYWKNIFYTALGFLKSPESAQDVVQDVFLKLWQKREQLAEVNDLRSYMFTIARNALINSLRKKSRVDSLDRQYREFFSGKYLLPEDRTAVRQLEELIAEAAARLPARQREILMLTRELGFSHSQIATHMGIARKTVANLITKALVFIRQYIYVHGDKFVASNVLALIGSVITH